MLTLLELHQCNLIPKLIILESLNTICRTNSNCSDSRMLSLVLAALHNCVEIFSKRLNEPCLSLVTIFEGCDNSPMCKNILNILIDLYYYTNNYLKSISEIERQLSPIIIKFVK